VDLSLCPRKKGRGQTAQGSKQQPLTRKGQGAIHTNGTTDAKTRVKSFRRKKNEALDALFRKGGGGGKRSRGKQTGGETGAAVKPQLGECFNERGQIREGERRKVQGRTGHLDWLKGPGPHRGERKVDVKESRGKGPKISVEEKERSKGSKVRS